MTVCIFRYRQPGPGTSMYEEFNASTVEAARKMVDGLDGTLFVPDNATKATLTTIGPTDPPDDHSG